MWQCARDLREIDRQKVNKGNGSRTMRGGRSCLSGRDQQEACYSTVLYKSRGHVISPGEIGEWKSIS